MTMYPSTTADASRTTYAPTREYRAMWTFAISSAFLVVGLVLVLGRASGVAVSIGGFVAAVVGTVVAVIEARGLSRRREWARYAMTPMLWIYVVAGLVTFLAALAGNSLNIPFGAILAAWALSAKPSEALGPVPASSPEGTYLIVGTVLPVVIQFF
jgi:hypothetical protein